MLVDAVFHGIVGFRGDVVFLRPYAKTRGGYNYATDCGRLVAIGRSKILICTTAAVIRIFTTTLCTYDILTVGGIDLRAVIGPH